MADDQGQLASERGVFGTVAVAVLARAELDVAGGQNGGGDGGQADGQHAACLHSAKSPQDCLVMWMAPTRLLLAMFTWQRPWLALDPLRNRYRIRKFWKNRVACAPVLTPPTTPMFVCGGRSGTTSATNDDARAGELLAFHMVAGSAARVVTAWRCWGRLACLHDGNGRCARQPRQQPLADAAGARHAHVDHQGQPRIVCGARQLCPIGHGAAGFGVAGDKDHAACVIAVGDEDSVQTGYSPTETVRNDMGPGHPECAERLDAIEDRLLMTGVADALDRRDAPRAMASDLELAHERLHIAAIRGLSEMAGDNQAVGGPDTLMIDTDTSVNVHTWNAALRASGAALAATDAVIGGELENAFCACVPPRPPANPPAKPMGFCFFNNVALAQPIWLMRPPAAARGDRGL
ncbi:hypothetical protein FQA39_LY19305 [Lamprigera yunnana]|nr:hypothetical protein FQA39_LY19305 [Lamprigera yunnana]